MPSPADVPTAALKNSDATVDSELAAAITGIEREFDALVAQFLRAARKNAQLISDGMLPGAYKVLTSIARAGSVTLSELTDALMLDKGQMSRTVRELDERGLITRAPDPTDGRSVLISLSDYGADQLAEVQGSQKSLLRSAIQEWSLADINRFTELLHALAHGVTPR